MNRAADSLLTALFRTNSAARCYLSSPGFSLEESDQVAIADKLIPINTNYLRLPGELCCIDDST